MSSNDILLTGYGPWDDFEENPSGKVSERLGGIVLPVDFDEAPKIIQNRVEENTNIKAVVMLGLAASINLIAIEKAAYNTRWDYLDENDMPKDIIPGSPERLETNLPVNDLVASLINRGYPARISYQPGDYVCNNLYYQTLSYVGVPSVFIHLPLEEVLGLDKMTEAVRLCLDELNRFSF